MSNYVPKNPDAIENYEELLAEYNTVFGVKYKFYFDYDYPRRIHFHVYEDSTTDGYEVWIMKDCDENVYLGENVYYYQPGVDDMFSELNNCFSHLDEVLIHCELDFSEVEYYMREELEQNYYNYQRELEDAE
jgi:acetyltransferase-like isoleucine patch superfamily enzyme